MKRSAIGRENKKGKGARYDDDQNQGDDLPALCHGRDQGARRHRGIKDVRVDLEKGEATFTEEKPVDRALIRERIAKAGFERCRLTTMSENDGFRRGDDLRRLRPPRGEGACASSPG